MQREGREPAVEETHVGRGHAQAEGLAARERQRVEDLCTHAIHMRMHTCIHARGGMFEGQRVADHEGREGLARPYTCHTHEDAHVYTCMGCMFTTRGVKASRGRGSAPTCAESATGCISAGSRLYLGSEPTCAESSTAEIAS